MDAKRKRTYLIIITVCLIFSAGILYWGLGGKNRPEPSLPLTSPEIVVNEGVGMEQGIAAPSVFPQNTNFNFSVLDNRLKSFREFSPLVNDPNLLGRDDPFRNY